MNPVFAKFPYQTKIANMGIRHLTQWIKWMNCIQSSVDWSVLRGTHVGIDVLGILYKARSNAIPILQVIYYTIVELRKREVEPIVVFDGRSPREKAGTRLARRQAKAWLSEDVQKRHSISSDDRNDVKQLLYALGVLCLNAEEEADAVLAFLTRNGNISAVITSDMDFLPRGIQTLIIPNSLVDISIWASISLKEVLKTAKLSYDQFVEMCVLLGCDYAPNIPTLSYKSAYWRIRKEGMLEILAAEGIRTYSLWQSAIAILRGEKDQWDGLLGLRQREKWASGPPPTEPDAPILQKAIIA